MIVLQREKDALRNQLEADCPVLDARGILAELIGAATMLNNPANEALEWLVAWHTVADLCHFLESHYAAPVD